MGLLDEGARQILRCAQDDKFPGCHPEHIRCTQCKLREGFRADFWGITSRYPGGYPLPRGVNYKAGYHQVATQAKKLDSQAMFAMRAATRGSAVMNVNSGGPHILLFERDQQLTTLLVSEFQLAGYECHPARTAVEVFDAIARYPIRLVLVNLAQAAASRREFWVALDAQRRGRGVQVLTFLCMNIAGYGSDDSEESSRIVLTDMEVDGMMGVMKLVDGVRTRIPGSTTGSYSRMANIPLETGNANKLNSQAEVVEPSVISEVTSQTTASLSMLSTNPSLAVPSSPNATSSEPVNSVRMNKQGNPASGFTDKIRAVIYPSSRAVSPMPETNRAPHNPQNVAATQQVASAQDIPARPQEMKSDNPLLNSEVGSQRQLAPTIHATPESISAPSPLQEQESGLAQLSRMVHEGHFSEEDKRADSNMLKHSTSPLVQEDMQQARSQATKVQSYEDDVMASKATSQQNRPVDAKAISTLPLRASPIQDIPIEREQEYRSGHTGAQSILSEDTVSGVGSAPPTSISSASRKTLPPSKEAMSPGTTDLQDTEKKGEESTPAIEEDVIARVFAEMPRQGGRQTLNQLSSVDATSDDTLLNIVQSLPPVSSLPTPLPQPKPPVLSGRATRSLGSVLLEGHLVPQHRLEVAQRIQRMLHGVDMNYQLGEILLMFKLLTPDQLLAASLVSYGLISTTQISSLGRIRQELHVIGLEYDLESLLVLFRILTPEQLREVRASWSG